MSITHKILFISKTRNTQFKLNKRQKKSFSFCSDYDLALEKIEQEQFAILIIDFSLGVKGGLEFIDKVEKINKDFYQVVIISEELEAGVDLRIANQVLNDVKTEENIENIIEKGTQYLLQKRKSNIQNTALKRTYKNLNKDHLLYDYEIIGINKGLKGTFDLIESVAKFPINVLLNGETGTGKELLAHYIHDLSNRANNNFIKINCAALPESLIESELFGHEKGAFTDAISVKKGKIELAHKGTLFLDEITEINLDMQAKLLRVLQEKKVSRIGSNEILDLDFALITATNKNIEKEVQNGNFRSDLYYRISTFPIIVPPLRERKEDIAELFFYFVEKFCDTFGINPPDTDNGIFDILENYSWPGNVRELENVTKRVLIMLGKQTTIVKEHFSFIKENLFLETIDKYLDQISRQIVNGDKKLKDIEQALVMKILDYFHGDIAMAVARTAISKNKFYKYKSLSNQ